MKTTLFIKVILLLHLCLYPLVIVGQEKSVESENEEKTAFVIIDSSSNDAVIHDQTDFFEQNPLCRLTQNQTVTLTDSTDGEYVLIIAKCDGKTVTGWVKKQILAEEPFKNNPKVSESAGASSVAHGAKGNIGYGPIDTTGFKKQEISPPWNNIDLSSYSSEEEILSL